MRSMLWVALSVSLVPAWAGELQVIDAETVPYGVTGSRFPSGLGNHRARVQVFQKADAVRAHIPWRRRDLEPEKKNVLVVNAAGKTVPNRVVAVVNRESGDVVFQAVRWPRIGGLRRGRDNDPPKGVSLWTRNPCQRSRSHRRDRQTPGGFPMSSSTMRPALTRRLPSERLYAPAEPVQRCRVVDPSQLGSEHLSKRIGVKTRRRE